MLILLQPTHQTAEILGITSNCLRLPRFADHLSRENYGREHPALLYDVDGRRRGTRRNDLW